MISRHSQRVGKTLSMYNDFLLNIYRELEEDIRYIMRCLQRVNQPFALDKMYSVNGDNIYAVMYPYDGESNLKDCNPMFFLGLRIKITQKDQRHIIVQRINQISDIW